MPYTYRKHERLRKNSEFVATMKGKRLSIDGLSLFYAQNGLGNFRIGISVSKKLSNAVARNRLRRQIRDCIGKALRDRSSGYDLVFVARQGLAGLDYGQILRAVETVLRKASFYKQAPEGNQL